MDQIYHNFTMKQSSVLLSKRLGGWSLRPGSAAVRTVCTDSSWRCSWRSDVGDGWRGRVAAAQWRTGRSAGGTTPVACDQFMPGEVQAAGGWCQIGSRRSASQVYKQHTTTRWLFSTLWYSRAFLKTLVCRGRGVERPLNFFGISQTIQRLETTQRHEWLTLKLPGQRTR